MSDLSSAARKRARDRRAQQTLRDKKLRYKAKLEMQVAHCEQYHDEKGVQNLLELVEDLRKQNEALVARQKALRALVGSWDEELELTESSNPSMIQNTSNGALDLSFPMTHSILRDSQFLGMVDHPHPTTPNMPLTSTSPLQQAHKDGLTEFDSPWNELPLYSDDFSSLQTVSCPWFAYSEQIPQCPDTPESPLDILYGSKTNPLANMIHMAIERRPVRDPERLAMGWIAYHFSKWIITPSPRTYENLPLFLRPVKEQYQMKHPIAVSCVPWPKLRSNLIRQWSMYNNIRDDFFGLFSCCVKIRWPWGVKVLERNEENVLCFKPSFYETFMKEEGWGITQEFINKYPNLMVGIDVGSLVFKIT
ncbi:hypothetical protein N7474_002539 [Penicillium riverlandense]|uniref:uncharacterized protein n=1 Tax=Penicillium riverlandense TaxID=1903569 RepID=UPI0025483C83|nr:uncharacterized protein N7474_002539 [Penicillium riverlandense]KAJ5825401.1 hypothetical protein N7474_002539 [Penicillium riverlandense]